MASKEPKRSKLQAIGPLMGLGMQLALTVAVFGAVGWWLDGELETGPWLFVTFLLIGIVGGMISFIRTALKAGGGRRKSS